MEVACDRTVHYLLFIRDTGSDYITMCHAEEILSLSFTLSNIHLLICQKCATFFPTLSKMHTKVQFVVTIIIVGKEY